MDRTNYFFGLRLKKAIADAGLTQAEFARQIRKDPAWLSHIIHGERHPSFDPLQTLILHLPGVNVKWLVMGD